MMKAVKDKVQFSGRYKITHKRKGKIIEEFYADNLVVDQGKTYMLSVGLGGGSQITPWYVGLFGGDYTPGASDNGTTFATVAEEFDDYDETTRPEWEHGAAASKTITNSANRATFTISTGVDDVPVYGCFIVSTSVKGATGGTLYSGARFDAARNVNDGDELLVTYTGNAP
jgi:hypothetical protein